tara:strand:+ start:317 stop:775 length:459 start_codon:yes stop_codon:yes gene_type:complete
MPAPQTGRNGILYYNSGTDASPTWVEVTEVGDVSIGEQNLETADFISRSTDWLLKLASHFSAEVTLNLHHDTDETLFDAILGFFTGKTATIFAVADGAIATAGTHYFKIPALITAFSYEQEANEAENHELTLEPTYFLESGSLISPAWVQTT